MNKKETKAFERLINEASRKSLIDVYIESTKITENVYAELLRNLREKIDEQLKILEEKDGKG